MTTLHRSELKDGSSRGPTPRRLEDLEQRFHDLEEHIDESPVRQALSVLHGMIQEVRRERRKDAGGSATPLDDIANTRKIRAVVAGGRYFSREDLDALLRGVEARAEGR